MFLYTSDGGPDQAKFKRALLAESMGVGRHLVIVTPCFMHCIQLVIKKGLLLLDRFLAKHGKSFKFFGSLAKISHVWRDAGGDVFDMWHSMFGAINARQFANKLPPKCLAGRWDSVYACETFLLAAAGWAQLGGRASLGYES
jgi:hypothetical protein